MERLFAPWRIDYILGEKEHECIFCTKPHSDEDEENLMVHRAEGAFVMMNKYPYNSGHLLVCPYRHVSDICDLTAEENALVMEEVVRAVEVIRDVMKPDGFNIGLNIGEDAGAGIEEHLHYHVVPRWRGDSNIMAVLTDIRIIPEHLRTTRRKLAEAFHRLFPASQRKGASCDS
jgi:ATP adenylyltransferase